MYGNNQDLLQKDPTSKDLFERTLAQRVFALKDLLFKDLNYQAKSIVMRSTTIIVDLNQGPKGMPDQEISVQNKDKQPKN